MFPTYREFSKWHDGYMLKFIKKPRRQKWIKKIYYPFALLGLCIIYSAFFWLFVMVFSAKKRSYRYSNKYKKVIKEGVFFDTVEYHEI